MSVACKCGAAVTISAVVLQGGARLDAATATASIAAQLGWTRTAAGAWRCANCSVRARGKRGAS